MNKRKNSTKRSFVMSLISLFVCVAMLIGTTFAWFTDTVTSGKNQIVAGNLDVELEYSKDGRDWHKVEGSSDLFDNTALWEPNHTEYVYLKVTNKGTLALNYALNVTPIDEIGGINQEGNSFKLSDYLVFGTVQPTETAFTFTDRAAAQTAAGNTYGLNQGNLTKTGELKNKGDVVYTALVIYMPSSVGNVANYKTGTTPPQIDFGVTLTATQNQHENDSFGNDYDANADLTPDNADKGSVDYEYSAQVNQTGMLVVSESKQEISTEGATTTKDPSGQVTSYIITSDATVPDDTTNTPIAKASIPYEAIDWTNTAEGNKAAEVAVAIDKTDTPSGITIQDEQESKTLEIKVTGLRADNNSPVTLDVFYGKNLDNVQLYHNSELMTQKNNKNEVGDNNTYYYEPSTGIITLASTSFSPFTAIFDTPVALVGSTSYTDLQDALDAAPVGATVVLLKDVTGDRISVVKNVTIDGNGFILTDNQSGGRAIWIDNTNVTLNIKNLTIDGSGKCERGVQANQLSSGEWNNANINMDQCVLKNFTHYAINLTSKTTVNLNITNSTISGWAAINAYGTGNIIKVTNSILEGINDKSYDGWNDFATVCLEGDTTGHSTLGSADYNVIIEKSTIIAKQTTGNQQAAIGFNANSKNSTVELIDTEIELGDEEKCSFAYDGGTGNKIIVDGELIHETPAANCWYSNRAFNNNKEGGMYTVFSIPFQEQWLADGEGIVLEADINLENDLECSIETGSFYLYFDRYSINGGKILLNSGVSVISDKSGKSNVFGGGNITETANSDGTYTYTCLESN